MAYTSQQLQMCRFKPLQQSTLKNTATNRSARGVRMKKEWRIRSIFSCRLFDYLREPNVHLLTCSKLNGRQR
eukprot:429458-Pleurochrysis_carterae.AAC.3